MQVLSFIFFVFLSCGVCAQNSIFVRVYNLTAEISNKGRVVTVTDSLMQLKGKDGVINIPVSEIGYIKTKRSDGNNVLVSSMIGSTTAGILGAASADPDALWFGYSAGEGALAGALIGLPVGAAIGGLTLLFKNSKTYLINGDLMKWKVFQSVVLEKSIKSK